MPETTPPNTADAGLEINTRFVRSRNVLQARGEEEDTVGGGVRSLLAALPGCMSGRRGFDGRIRVGEWIRCSSTRSTSGNSSSSREHARNARCSGRRFTGTRATSTCNNSEEKQEEGVSLRTDNKCDQLYAQQM